MKSRTAVSRSELNVKQESAATNKTAITQRGVAMAYRYGDWRRISAGSENNPTGWGYIQDGGGYVRGPSSEGGNSTFVADGAWENIRTGETSMNPHAGQRQRWDYNPYLQSYGGQYDGGTLGMMASEDVGGADVQGKLEEIFGAHGKGPGELMAALQQMRIATDHGLTNDVNLSDYVQRIAGFAGIDAGGRAVLEQNGPEWTEQGMQSRKAAAESNSGYGQDIMTMGKLGAIAAGMYGAGSYFAGSGLGGLGGAGGLETGALAGGEAAAPTWMSNVPSGSVFSAPVGVPSVGLGTDLGAGIGGNMITTGGTAAPWYSGIGANSGLGPLATGAGENMGLYNPSLGSASSATNIPTAPPVSATKGIFDQAKDTAKAVAPYAPLLGAGAGLLGGGTKPAGSITIEEGIPDWLKGYMKPALDKYSTDIQNYNTDPYGIMPAAMTEFRNTVNGTHLDPSTNKWLPEYFKLGAERVKGTLSPSFGHMQAFGSNTGYNEALSRGLGDLATGLYGGAYERERDRQSQAIGAAPSFLTNASQSAFAPYKDYLGTLGGLGKKKEEPYFDQSALSKMFGGALAGYSLGNIFK